MATTKKHYVYKVYNPVSGRDNSVDNLIAVWSEDVISDPSFRWGINGGPQELRVRLARNYDDFGEDADVKLNNDVVMECFDREATNGAAIYRGFISQYCPVIEGKAEYVDVILQGYVFTLARLFLKDSGGNTAITYNSYDPSDILEDLIDKYRAAGGVVNYTASSIQATGTTVSYTFNLSTYKEAIDKVLELCPEGWYWYIDPTNTIYLKSEASTPDHKLFIGRDVSRLEANTNMESVVNALYFVGGTPGGGSQIYRYYSRTGSINTYGPLAQKEVDHRVTLTATADVMANRILDAQDTPKLGLYVDVVDNNGEDGDIGYDIESFEVGDVVRIQNLKQGTRTVSKWGEMVWGTDVWGAVLAYTLAEATQIVGISYTPDKVTLETAVGVPHIPKRMEDYYRNIDVARLAEEDLMETPTAA
jgi:hypothetical protein